jgi:hypothetical protein
MDLARDYTCIVVSETCEPTSSTEHTKRKASFIKKVLFFPSLPFYFYRGGFSIVVHELPLILG